MNMQVCVGKATGVPPRIGEAKNWVQNSATLGPEWEVVLKRGEEFGLRL